MSRFLIPLADYNRIHQVAHGVLRDVANVERACIFFASFGAYILNKHYRIPARVVAGAFGLCVSDKPDVAFFGKEPDGTIGAAADDAFHMWILTETHVIDFMAPVFAEAFGSVRPDVRIPRRMLQRRRDSESESPDGLRAPGDFITYPDPALTDALVDNFLKRPGNQDLVFVGEAWFGSRRAKQEPKFAMRDSHGQVFDLTLPSTAANGAW